MEYLHREIAYCQSWQGSRLTQFYRDRVLRHTVGLFPAPSYAVDRNHACQARLLGCTKAGAQRLVCAIVMLDETLSNRQAAPISPRVKLALTPKNIYDPRMPEPTNGRQYTHSHAWHTSLLGK